MDTKYYYNKFEQLSEVVKEATEKRISFFQYVLLVSSSILGIIISLHTTNSQCLYIRLVFVLSVIFLLLGALCMVVVLYDFSNFPERARQAYLTEIGNAMKNDEKVQPVFVNPHKRTLIFEKLSYIFLFLGLISLVTYTVLISI
jgi:hypothetical protein